MLNSLITIFFIIIKINRSIYCSAVALTQIVPSAIAKPTTENEYGLWTRLWQRQILQLFLIEGEFQEFSEYPTRFWQVL